jgi:proteasome lid subunit RPN8/RPN11
MNQAVKLPQSIYHEIITHSCEGKPEEVCGIIRGVDLVATSLKRSQNIAENRVIHYEVDSQTLLEFALHEDEMVGVYHSHPESPAYPSATDAWIAEYPNKIYFICSLEDDAAPVVRAFRMIAHFPELDIPVLRQALAFYETRPHLYAYFQSVHTPPPSALSDLARQVGIPFYLVYYSEDQRDFDSRVVVVEEHPVEVVSSQ